MISSSLLVLLFCLTVNLVSRIQQSGYRCSVKRPFYHPGPVNIKLSEFWESLFIINFWHFFFILLLLLLTPTTTTQVILQLLSKQFGLCKLLDRILVRILLRINTLFPIQAACLMAIEGKFCAETERKGDRYTLNKCKVNNRKPFCNRKMVSSSEYFMDVLWNSAYSLIYFMCSWIIFPL